MNDIGNAMFEAVGAAVLVLHCRRLYRDKQLRGVSLVPFFFYAVWGYWNLVYYPSVGSWYSAAAGVFVAAVNTAFCVMAVYYKRREQ